MLSVNSFLDYNFVVDTRYKKVSARCWLVIPCAIEMNHCVYSILLLHNHKIKNNREQM